ncbi:hypothetical protein ACKF11_15310, partial [Methylobacillus sp. Pita2]|uniref:hypothetical protein n=1 Tax=Methylobacillus sp. Pita2 TaxID=3383245 RepID=UPI0038B48BE9
CQSGSWKGQGSSVGRITKLMFSANGACSNVWYNPLGTAACNCPAGSVQVQIGVGSTYNYRDLACVTQ